MPKPTLTEYAQIIFLLFDSVRDLFPTFEQRMINRERRLRLRYAEGKITDEKLAIELETIRQKRAAKG